MKKICPILMYHGVVSKNSPPAVDREDGAEIYDVKIDEFKLQIDWLKSRGYKTQSINGEPELSSKKSVVLTFDDGEMNNFDEVLPVLKKNGFHAYFFIIAKRVGEEGYMSIDQLKKITDDGMTVGSHGLSHEILTDLLDTQIEHELTASKKFLEVNLGIPITCLSIPRGFCNDRILSMAYDCGYKTVFISDRNKEIRLNSYERVAIKGTWDLQRFELAMMGKMPFSEKCKEFIKKTIKFILRERGYDFLRKMIIQLSK